MGTVRAPGAKAITFDQHASTITDSTLLAKRVLSVDVLRGLCVAGMVLVNFPTDWVLRYHQLGHAEWNGATATDMIFPEFLFLSGFSMVYSFSSRSKRGETRGKLAWHVVVRSMLLLILGLILNAVPTFDWQNLHVFGVLQRIALCYLIGGLLVIGTAQLGTATHVNVPAVVMACGVVLMGIWASVRFIHVPGYESWRFDHDGNLGAVVDRAIFSNRHLSDWGGRKRMWDADGLLSCMSSIPNLLLGVLAAVWVRKSLSLAKTVGGMVLLSGILIAAGMLLNSYLVINRKLWTDSFTILSSGVSLGLFALFYFWLDGNPAGASEGHRRWWLTPALVYGSNATLGFVVYSLLLVLPKLDPVPGSHELAYWLSETAFRTFCRWINPYNLSLLYGLVAVGVVMGLLWPFYQRRMFLRL